MSQGTKRKRRIEEETKKRLENLSRTTYNREGKGHVPNHVSCVAVTLDGNSVITGSADATAARWDLRSGRLTRKYEKGHSPVYKGRRSFVTSLCVTKTYLATSGSDEIAVLWNLSTGDVVRKFGITDEEDEEYGYVSHHGHIVWSVLVTADEKLLVTGSHLSDAALWDVSTGTLLRTFDDAYISRYSNGDIALWDMNTGVIVSKNLLQRDGGTCGPSGPTCVAFSPDGISSASGSADGIVTIRSVDKETDDCRRFKGHGGEGVTSVCFSPCGKFLASGSMDCTAVLWDVAKGTMTARFDRGTARDWNYWIRSVCFTPDGKSLVTGCNDGTATLWGVSSDAVNSASDGGTAATSSESSAVVVAPQAKRRNTSTRVYVLCVDLVVPVHEQDFHCPESYFTSTKVVGVYSTLRAANRAAREWCLDKFEEDGKNYPSDFSGDGYFHRAPGVDCWDRDTRVYILKAPLGV